MHTSISFEEFHEETNTRKRTSTKQMPKDDAAQGGHALHNDGDDEQKKQQYNHKDTDDEERSALGLTYDVKVAGYKGATSSGKEDVWLSSLPPPCTSTLSNASNSLTRTPLQLPGFKPLSTASSSRRNNEKGVTGVRRTLTRIPSLTPSSPLSEPPDPDPPAPLQTNRTPLPQPQTTSDNSSSDESTNSPEMSNPLPNGDARVTRSGKKELSPCWSAGTITLHTLREGLAYSKTFLERIEKGRSKEVGIIADLLDGFDAHVELKNYVMSAHARLLTLKIEELFDDLSVRFLGENWEWDLQAKIALDHQQKGSKFKYFAEAAIATNTYLAGRPSFLPESVLQQRLKISAGTHLQRLMSTMPDELCKKTNELGNRIATNTNDKDPSKKELLDDWIGKMDDIERAYIARHSEFKDFEPSRSHSSNNNKPVTVAAAPVPYSQPNAYNNQNPRNNYQTQNQNRTYNAPNSSNSNTVPFNAPTSYNNHSTYPNNIQNNTFPNNSTSRRFPPALENAEHDILWISKGCKACRIPFQCHKKTDNACQPCNGTNYRKRDAAFVHEWIRANPQGRENGSGSQTMKPPTWTEFLELLRVEKPDLYNDLPSNLRTSGRTAAVTQVFMDPGPSYVAPVVHSTSHRDVVYSRTAVVGESSDEEDFDSSDDNEQSPPVVNKRAKVAASMMGRRSMGRDNWAPPSSPTPAEEWNGINKTAEF